MTSAILQPARRVGGRDEARTLFSNLPANLVGATIDLHFGSTTAASPSFIDELLVGLLLERHAAKVRFLAPLERTAGYATACAERRRITDRIEILDTRPNPE